MIRIAARGVVTPMADKHPLGDVAKRQFVSVAVGKDQAMPNPYSTVPSANFSACEVHAARALVTHKPLIE
jgi:hypothetical protein